MRNQAAIAFVGAALAALTGCFKEPVPADKTVPPETRVWLKGKGLVNLSVDAVFKDGLVFLGDAGWTNLSARVEKFDPASIDYLNLDYNALTNVEALSAFTGLRWLRLNDNALASLPDLSSLVKLRRVYFKNNRLAEVPAFLKDLPELDTVDLSGTQISQIPDWFAQKGGLSHLILSNTRISKLPSDLSAWKSLKSLQMGGLKMESLAEMKRIRSALPDTTIVF